MYSGFQLSVKTNIAYALVNITTLYDWLKKKTLDCLRFW